MGNTDETGTESPTEIGGIGARQGVGTGARPTHAFGVTELDTGLLPPGSLVAAEIGPMVPNRRHPPLVLNFQILSPLRSLEGIVAR